uniref:Uncharacterized protein n=1 Tax=Physcomitrium patens TaxID=3218 RepID=A0A2K1JIL6_PHYPA|nr:hypothetical protein PHYPA_018795 [Physcomitrium patens]
MTMLQLKMRALIIIVPFAAAFLVEILCIYRHMIFFWSLRKDESESDATGSKVVTKNVKKGSLIADKYCANAKYDNGFVESKLDSILMVQLRKGGCKSLCT